MIVGENNNSTVCRKKPRSEELDMVEIYVDI